MYLYFQAIIHGQEVNRIKQSLEQFATDKRPYSVVVKNLVCEIHCMYENVLIKSIILYNEYPLIEIR